MGIRLDNAMRFPPQSWRLLECRLQRCRCGSEDGTRRRPQITADFCAKHPGHLAADLNGFERDSISGSRKI